MPRLKHLSAPWTEWCSRCSAYTPHHHEDTHTRRRGENAHSHVRHDRTKLCSRCQLRVSTVEIPRDLLAVYGTAQAAWAEAAEKLKN